MFSALPDCPEPSEGVYEPSDGGADVNGGNDASEEAAAAAAEEIVNEVQEQLQEEIQEDALETPSGPVEIEINIESIER